MPLYLCQEVGEDEPFHIEAATHAKAKEDAAIWNAVVIGEVE